MSPARPTKRTRRPRISGDAIVEKERFSASLLRLRGRFEHAQSYRELLEAAREEVRSVVGYPNLWAYLLSEDKKHAHLLAATGPISGSIGPSSDTQTLTITGDPMLEEIASAKKIVVVRDARTDPRTNKEIVARLGNRTIVNIPILLSDKLLGSVGTGTFGDEGIHVPTSAEREFLVALGSHMAVSIDRIRLLLERAHANEQLRRLNRELQAISTCNQALLRAVDEQSLLNDICRIVCDEAGYGLAWVGYVEHDEAKSVRPVAWAGVGSDYVEKARISWAFDNERGRGPGGLAIRSGKPVYVQDLSTDPRMAMWRDSTLALGYRSTIAMPLNDDSGTTFGVLFTYSFESNTITPDEVRLLQELSGDMAYGIVTLRARLSLRQSTEELQTTSDLLRATIEAAPVAIIGLDLDGRVQHIWNPTAEKMLGWRSEEVMGKFLPTVPRDKEEEFRSFRESVRRGLTLDGIEVTRRRRDGSPIDYSIYASPLHGAGGEIVGNIAVMVDITERKRDQKALSESEERYRLIAENTADTIAVSDLKLKTVYVSPSVLKLRGYTAQEAKSQSLDQILTPSSLEIVRNALAMELELEAGGQADPSRTALFELEEYCKDGSTIWVELSASLLKDNAGKPTGILTVARDITKRKHAELQLVESEQKYRSLAESSPDNIIRYDSIGRMVYLNRNVEATVDSTLRTYIGRLPHYDVESPDQVLYRDTVARVIQTGRPEELEMVITNPQGEQRTHLVRFVAEHAEDGKITGALAIGRDITERIRAEVELRRLNHAIEQSPVSVIMTDTAGNIEYVNPKFTEVTGYTRDEVRGKNPRILKSGETASEEYGQLWRAITEGKEWRGEFHNRKKSGELFWEAASISPVRDDKGVVTHFVAIKEEITQRKHDEEAIRRSLREKEVMLKEIHHRVKNNLQVICSLLHMQADELPEGPAHAALQESETRVRSMALVHEKLYGTADFTSVDLLTYCESLARQLAIGQSVHGVTISVQGERVPVDIDIAIPFGLILNELLTNALEHAFVGRERGSVNVNVRQAAGGTIELRVHDDGVGFPAGTDFLQMASMGMTLVTNLVMQLSGRLSLEQDGGSKFTLIFPAKM